MVASHTLMTTTKLLNRKIHLNKKFLHYFTAVTLTIIRNYSFMINNGRKLLRNKKKHIDLEQHQQQQQQNTILIRGVVAEKSENAKCYGK